MPIDVKMPALSSTMESGNVVRWRTHVGQAVKRGEPLVEIETDKTTLDVEAEVDGTLAQILVTDGTDAVAVGTVIAVLEPATTPQSTVHHPEPSVTRSEGADGVRSSPLARRIAREQGIELARIMGTGPGGRIVRADLAERSGSRGRTRLTGMRRAIAQRMVAAKATVPHAYLTVDVQVDALSALRTRVNKNYSDDHKVSFNDFLIKAQAIALRRTPDANVQYAADALLSFAHIDLSVAVAIEGGVVMPVLRRVDEKSLAQIAADMRELTARARAGRLVPSDSEGGSAALSNLGMFEVKQFAAIINPPQSLILAVGAARKQPVAIADRVVIATIMTVTASFDHRAMDGVACARFLSAFKTSIEQQPDGLLA